MPGPSSLLTSIDRRDAGDAGRRPARRWLRWSPPGSAAISEAGHDLRGDLDRLVEPGLSVSLPGPRDQLSVAVDALAETLAENSRLRDETARLEADRARLDRKRRKLKRRLRGRPAGHPSLAELEHVTVSG